MTTIHVVDDSAFDREQWVKGEHFTDWPIAP
jgi:hypothetical protein